MRRDQYGVGQRLYPVAAQAYKPSHVVADDHKHYLPGGLMCSNLPGKWCLRVRTDPYLYPIRLLKDATHVRRDPRL